MTVSGVHLIDVMIGVFAACVVGYVNNGLAASSNCPLNCKFCSPSRCFTCEIGYFGMDCQYKCSNCKPDTKCAHDTGFCEAGCKDGLSGKHCDVSCDSRCHACSRNNSAECVACENNQSCELTCPSNCQNNSCDGIYCTEGCLTGSWGQSCEKDCPANCSRLGCNRENGSCPKGFGVPVVVSIHNVALPVMSVLLVTLSGLLFAMILWKRRPARHQNSHGVVYKPENPRRYMETENRSGTSDENNAISTAINVKDNVTQVSGKNKLSYFSQLCMNDDLQNQYKPLAESICTTRSERGISERQKQTQKTVSTAGGSIEFQYEDIQDYGTHTSETASAYITPIN